MSKPFWEWCRKHELRIQQCLGCSAFRFPPQRLCPECLGEASEWRAVSGRGTLYSFVVYHRLYNPAFSEDLPYNVAVVQLAEGPRLLSTIVGCPNEILRCDMPVEVVFDDVTPEVTLPKFRPLTLPSPLRGEDKGEG
jgi:uncharacterized OB-fold protein